MKKSLMMLALVSLVSSTAMAQDNNEKKPEKSPKKKELKASNTKSKSKKASVTIDGKVINYTVTASELTLETDDAKRRADIFSVSYIVDNPDKNIKRPVLFAFNGGPGSSAVWLHLGALGPKIVPTPTDGTTAQKPPVVLVDNPLSILDVADLVFIDPTSTGFSRVAKNGNRNKLHSVSGDAESVSEFIRRWITEHKRWGSPKFLLGESYGAIRACGVCDYLQSRYRMQLNGVVLLSGLIDYRTLSPSRGNDLSYVSYLPSYAMVAHHHGVLKGDRDALFKKVNAFADNEYVQALHKGATLSEAEKKKIATQLASLIGLDAELILEHNLRVHPSTFRAKLLQSKQLIIGRFDGRVKQKTPRKNASYPSFDPSLNVVDAAFTSSMMSFLSDLGWDDKREYRILTGAVHPWSYGANNSYVNLSKRIESSVRDNPKLKFLIQCGRTDLATPPGGILHSVNHLDLTTDERKNIGVTWYDAGHMFYLNQPDLVKCRKDIVEFINSAK